MSRERKGKFTSGKFAKRIIKKKLFNYIKGESESESSGGTRMFWKHKMHQAAVTLILADSVSVRMNSRNRLCGTRKSERARVKAQRLKLKTFVSKEFF